MRYYLFFGDGFMFTLKKQKNKDFVILNLSDPQLGITEWEPGEKNRIILEYTISELMKIRTPDLITVSGDIAWAGDFNAYDKFASYIDSFGIPWAPVWGNHDNQNGPDDVNKAVDIFLKHPHCIYEKGDPSLGNGNYVIVIENEDGPVEGLIMMDSHDRDPFIQPDGEETIEWGKLIPEQIVWYRERIKELRKIGCGDSSIILHIPIFAYRTAWEEAWNPAYDPKTLDYKASFDKKYWNEGYKDSFGVCHDPISSYAADEGMMDAIVEEAHTKNVLCGHDHMNNWCINFRGTNLIFTMKAGAGCYWEPAINGGTFMFVDDSGMREISHSFVDVTHLL